MPSDSNWNRPVVSPRPKSAYVSASSSGILSVSMSIPRNCLMSDTHSFSTVSVLRPRKSILRRPTGSTKCPSYCVVRSDSFSVGITGSVSISGSREMITPQACTPGWRMEPSRRAARSISAWTVGSGELNAATSSGE